MLRLAAILAVVLGVTVCLAYLHLLGKTPWSDAKERHLRAMKDRRGTPLSFEPATIAAITQLPLATPLAVRAGIEARGVSVEGHVQRILRAADGDLHLDFAPDSLGSALGPYLVAEITPGFRKGSTRWTYERLLELFRPVRGGETRWERDPRRLRLSGYLLYDDAHSSRPLRRDYPQALVAWEVHPVTRIEYWDETLGRFREYSR